MTGSAHCPVCLGRQDSICGVLNQRLSGSTTPGDYLAPWIQMSSGTRRLYRKTTAMCSVARSRQSYRYRTVALTLQGGKCLESGLSNGCGPTCEGSGTHCLHRWSDIRQGPDLSSTRYRLVPRRKTMQGSAYCLTPLVGRPCLVSSWLSHLTLSRRPPVGPSPALVQMTVTSCDIRNIQPYAKP